MHPFSHFKQQAWSRKILPFFTSIHFHGLLVFYGIALRAKLYLENCSFWGDESWVAVNIAGRSMSEIFHHVPSLHDWNNRPIVFSFLEKCLTLLLGNQESVFRLLPFIAGILALWVFYRLIKKILEPPAVSLALGLFALSGPLIQFSAQLKQFSCDLLVALLFFVYLERWMKRGGDKRGLIIMGLLGGFFIWCSYTVLFVLAGTGLILLGKYFMEGERDKAHILQGIVLFWVFNFVALYNLAIRHSIGNTQLIEYWHGAFMPTPLSIKSIVWIKMALGSIFQDPVDFWPPSFGVVFCAAGAFSLWKRSRQIFLFLALPVLLAFAAAVMRKYPFHGRFLLFLVPSLLIFAAEGFFVLVNKIPRARNLVAVFLAGFIFFRPVTHSVNYFSQSQCIQDNRGALQFLKENYQEGDFLFINSMGLFPFWYYWTNLRMYETVPLNINVEYDDGALPALMLAKIYDQRITKEGIEYGFFRYEFDCFTEGKFFRQVVVKNDMPDYSVTKDTPFKPSFKPSRVALFISPTKTTARPFFLDFFERQGVCVKKFQNNKAEVYFYDLHPADE